MKKTYLITGGSGFIGTAIAKRLIKEKDARVICLDSNLRGNFLLRTEFLVRSNTNKVSYPA